VIARAEPAARSDQRAYARYTEGVGET